MIFVLIIFIASTKIKRYYDIRKIAPILSCRIGNTSSANQAFCLSQMLLRGLGWGKGNMSGQNVRQALTLSVSFAWLFSPKCQTCAYWPMAKINSRLGICAKHFSRQVVAHSGLGGRSPDFPVPG